MFNKPDSPPQQQRRVRGRNFKASMPEVRVMSGEQIKNMRMRIGISQALLAKLLGMSVESVSKWERNEIVPSNPALRILNTIEAKGIDVFINQ